MSNDAFTIDAGGDVASGALEIEAAAVAAEADGFDGVFATETKHDPFVGLALAARRTERIDLVTAIAVAFARSPMTTAVLANDLHTLSGGRFVLGLGSQVKPHIEKRFSMPWSHPARRMAEYVRALRAIWTSWSTGERLRFDGEFYTHTLMTPFFSPGPNPHGTPPVWLAGVGELMTEAAGETADGFLGHSLTTRRYLTEVSLPALARGRARSELTEPAGISIPVLVAIGNDRASLDVASRAVKKSIAFYGSTPAYRSVLELHGWGELADRLNAGSRRGEWDEMISLVSDEVLHEFALVGSPGEIAAGLRERFAGIATRISFNAPYALDAGVWRDVLGGIRALERA